MNAEREECGYCGRTEGEGHTRECPDYRPTCPHPPLTDCMVCGGGSVHLFFDHMAMAWLCEPGWGHRSDEPEMCLPEHHA